MRRLAKIAVCMVLLALATSLMGAAPAQRRGSLTGQYGLELDGVFVGWVRSVEGGNAYAEVVAERLGSGRLQRKHIGQIKYEAITFQVGADMSKAFYQWLQGTLSGDPSRKNGAVVAADYNYRVIERLTFADAVITEIGLPALDASSKDPAYITVRIQPEMTRRTKPAGTAERLPAPAASKQKQWLTSNFRLRIDGLEEASSRVNKIEALTVKQGIVEDSIGEMRLPVIEMTNLEVPNLVITLAESHAKGLYDWHETLVIQGNSSEEQEKTGTLEFLSPDLREVLFRLTFHNLGIFRLAPEKAEAGHEAIRRLKAEMYCEEISLSVVGASALPMPKATPVMPIIVPDGVPQAPAATVRTHDGGME